MSDIKLPALFLKNMENLFIKADRIGEYSQFIESFNSSCVRGIRLNLTKINHLNKAGSSKEEENILHLVYKYFGDDSNPVSIPWTNDGYYLPEEVYPGKHPYYHAGLFYIQEPSAMLPAMLVDAKPGEKILDICAAPGGKSVKIATDMKGIGVLICNDVNSERVKALVKNIELQGCENVIVTNETPLNMSSKFENYFDKILVDAPCSGEGMFRRDENAVNSWEKFGNVSCTAMQHDILQHVDSMLKPGGEIVYSTCTFSQCENENLIEEFLLTHNNYSVVDLFADGSILNKLALENGPVRGISDNFELRRACRIFPHLSKGEGHFCVVIKKDISDDDIKSFRSASKSSINAKYKVSEPKTAEFSKNEFMDAFEKFALGILSEECILRIKKYTDQHFKIYKNHVYTFNCEILIPDGLHVIKKGFYLGELKKLRDRIIFEPSHHFIMSIKREEILSKISYEPDNPQIVKYLKGETIFAGDEIDLSLLRAGQYIAVCVSDYQLGWAKYDGNKIIKNLYPRGWRRQN